MCKESLPWMELCAGPHSLPHLWEVPATGRPLVNPRGPGPPREWHLALPTHFWKQWAADRIQYSSMMDPPQMCKPA